MPAFPERESSILALLKRKKPGRVPDTVEGKEDKSLNPSPINASQVRFYFQLATEILPCRVVT